QSVSSAPEIDAEGPVHPLPPALDDEIPGGVEPLRPVAHGELVVVGFPLHLFDREAMEQEFLDDVLNAQERVAPLPDVLAGEGADLVLLVGGGSVHVDPSAGNQVVPNQLAEPAIGWNVLDDPEDDDGIVRFFGTVLQEVFEPDLARQAGVQDAADV